MSCRAMLKPRGLWYVLSSSKAEESCFRLPLSPLQVDLVRILPFCTPLESPIFGVCSIATSCSSLLCDVQETICVWSLKVESKTDFSKIQENGNHLLVQIVLLMFYLIPYKPPLEMSFWNDFLPSWEPIESELLNLLKLSVNSFSPWFNYVFGSLTTSFVSRKSRSLFLWLFLSFAKDMKKRSV